jgi:hypothetical protein
VLRGTVILSSPLVLTISVSVAINVIVRLIKVICINESFDFICHAIEMTNADIAKLIEPATVFWLFIRLPDAFPHLRPPSSAMVSEIVKREIGR